MVTGLVMAKSVLELSNHVDSERSGSGREIINFALAPPAAPIPARRGRQLWRVLLCLAIGVVFAAGALEVWRGARMIGLPDIGDPFDVAAFRAFRVPEERDAFVLFRQAQAKLLGPTPNVPVALRGAGSDVWSKAAPELREWLIANREVLEMFRAASERPDGILHPKFDRFDQHQYLYLGEFKRLALLEGSRLEEQGDFAGAWSWYRTVFRMRAHVMRRGTSFQRIVAGWNCSGLGQRIASWAADRRTSVPLLRAALDDVRAVEPRPDWDAYSLKLDYLYLMNELNDEWGLVQDGEANDQNLRIAGEEVPPFFARRIYGVRRYYSTEPERSRRVLRLAFANWLAFVEDEHRSDRKPAVTRDVPIVGEEYNHVLLFGQSGCAGVRPQDAAESPGKMARQHARRKTAPSFVGLANDSFLRATRASRAGRATGWRTLPARPREGTCFRRSARRALHRSPARRRIG